MLETACYRIIFLKDVHGMFQKHVLPWKDITGWCSSEVKKYNITFLIIWQYVNKSSDDILCRYNRTYNFPFIDFSFSNIYFPIQDFPYYSFYSPFVVLKYHGIYFHSRICSPIFGWIIILFRGCKVQIYSSSYLLYSIFKEIFIYWTVLYQKIYAVSPLLQGTRFY